MRIVGGLVGAVAVLLAAGWLAFVPSAKEPGYEFVAAWGGAGTEPGRFNDPTGIAVANGEVFVSDARNGRIQVFAIAVAVAEDGSVFVADFGNNRIQKWQPRR